MPLGLAWNCRFRLHKADASFAGSFFASCAFEDTQKKKQKLKKRKKGSKYGFYIKEERQAKIEKIQNKTTGIL